MLTLLLSALGFLGGVAVATGTSFVLPSFLPLPLLVLLFWRPQWGVVFFAVCLGFLRVDGLGASPDLLLEREFFDEEGILVEEWSEKEGKVSWLLSTQRGILLVQLSAYEDWTLGQKLFIQGEVEPVGLYAKDTYLHYLQRHKVVGVLETPRVQTVQLTRPTLGGIFHILSNRLSERLHLLLPEPESSFAVGLLLGKRQAMAPHLQEAFQVVGLTHIVAISGSNIALVVALFFALFSFLPFRSRLLCSAVAVVLFVFLVGPTAAVLRAALMGILALLGLYGGRQSQVFFALLWSAVLMVVWNPLILLYDIGFQLSFASTLGILLLVPVFDRTLPHFPLKEALVLTVSAQITTLPFTVYYFGVFSWITPFANLLAAPFIPFAMAFSALALPFGVPAAALAWAALWLIERGALFCAAIPGVQMEISISGVVFGLSLAALGVFFLSFYRSKWVRAFFREVEGVASMERTPRFETREKQ